MTYLDPPKSARPTPTSESIESWWRGQTEAFRVDGRQLFTELLSFEPTLAARVHNLLQNSHWYFGGNAGQALRSNNVCGVASEILYDHLLNRGFHVNRVTRRDLNEKYPTPDHTFILAKVGAEVFIVDPAYYQFVRALNIPSSMEPVSNVLLLRQAEATLFAQRLSFTFGSMERTTISCVRYDLGAAHRRRFELSLDELVSYFRKVWSLHGTFPSNQRDKE